MSLRDSAQTEARYLTQWSHRITQQLADIRSAVPMWFLHPVQTYLLRSQHHVRRRIAPKPPDSCLQLKSCYVPRIVRPISKMSPFHFYSVAWTDQTLFTEAMLWRETTGRHASALEGYPFGSCRRSQVKSMSSSRTG